MRKLVNNRELSDVTFIVDGFPVYASRVHLALRSEHFRAMLYGGMRESEKGAEIEIKVCTCVGVFCVVCMGDLVVNSRLLKRFFSNGLLSWLPHSFRYSCCCLEEGGGGSHRYTTEPVPPAPYCAMYSYLAPSPPFFFCHSPALPSHTRYRARRTIALERRSERLGLGVVIGKHFANGTS